MTNNGANSCRAFVLVDERKVDLCIYIPFCNHLRLGIFYLLQRQLNRRKVKGLIQIKQVTKRYPVKNKGQEVVALQEVNLQIEKGDIFGIVGYSGAGKSTLLRLLNGLEKPSSGSVLVDGKDLSTLSDQELRLARQKIGMIFQHFHLLWSRTVRENIAFALEITEKSKMQIEKRTEELLHRVGLWERRDAYPSQLSGGQKQRVGIARALANEPDVLLCDEATSALDPETTDSILRLLQEINRETGITMVLITHEMSVVKAICNKVVVMDNGSIVESGDVQSVFRQPQHDVTKRFTKELKQHSPIDEQIGLTLEELQQLKQFVLQPELSPEEQQKRTKLANKIRLG